MLWHVKTHMFVFLQYFMMIDIFQAYQPAGWWPQNIKRAINCQQVLEFVKNS